MFLIVQRVPIMLSEHTSKPSASAPYKAVLIIGKDALASSVTIERFKQEGYLLIGDRRRNLKSLDFSILADRIDKNTRIYITAHGMVKDGIHSIEGMPTRNFLKTLSELSGGNPMNIQLYSCYGGSAAQDVCVLPKGSVLLLPSPSDTISAIELAVKTIRTSSNDLRETNLVQEFIQRFALYTTQTAIISIIKKDGSVFKYTIRHPNRFLTIPQEIAQYLEFIRNEFIEAYNKEFGAQFALHMPPRKSESDVIKEVIQWRNETFSYAAHVDDKNLINALKDRIEDFSDFINCELDEEYSSLVSAANEGYQKVVSHLSALSQTGVALPDNFAKIALMWAARIGDSKIVSFLLQSKINAAILNTQDQEGMTALMRAVQDNNMAVVSALLESAKVNVNLQNAFGKTALMLAIKGYNQQMSLKMVSAMLEFDNVVETANMTDNDGKTAAMLATESGLPQISIDIKDAIGELNYKKLKSAARGGNADVVMDVLPLLDPAVINRRTPQGRTILMQAAIKGHANVVDAMLKSPIYSKKAVNMTDEKGATAFILAAFFGQVNVIRVMLQLLDETAINMWDKHKCTALMSAAMEGRAEVVAEMLKFDKVVLGANIADTEGKTAAMLAREAGHIEIAEAIERAIKAHTTAVLPHLDMGLSQMNKNRSKEQSAQEASAVASTSLSTDANVEKQGASKRPLIASDSSLKKRPNREEASDYQQPNKITRT